MDRRIIVVYAGPGGTTSSQPPDRAFVGPVRLLGHETTEHENGITEVLVKWEYH